MSKKLIKVQRRKEQVRRAMKKRAGQGNQTYSALEYTPEELGYLDSWNEYQEEQKWG